MIPYETYCGILDEEASRMKTLAEQAKERGDERAHSICLMRASMLGDMLKALGRVEMEGRRPRALETLVESFSNEAEQKRKAGDYDDADRAEQKAITVQFALDALNGGDPRDA